MKLNKELLNVNLNNPELSKFTETFTSLLDKHTQKRQKYIRANHAYFMIKNLWKTFTLKVKFRNRILREKTEESKSLHSKHRNLCVNLLHKTKRNICMKLRNKTVS